MGTTSLAAAAVVAGGTACSMLGLPVSAQQVTQPAPQDDPNWRTGSDCSDTFGIIDLELCDDPDDGTVDLTQTCCGCSNFSPNEGMSTCSMGRNWPFFVLLEKILTNFLGLRNE